MQFKSLWFSYTADGKNFSFRTADSLQTADISLTVQTSGDVFSVSVFAKREIRIDCLRAVFACKFDASDRVFLNGYQSWTDSTEHTIWDKMRGIRQIPPVIANKYAFSQYGDYQFVRYGREPGHLHGWSYGYLRNGTHFRLAGSLAEDSGFTLLRTDPVAQEFLIEKDCRGLYLQGELDALRILFTEGTEKEVFDRYFNKLGIRLRPEAKPLFGYTSWYRHYQNISMQILRDDLAGLQTLPQKADVFQIDDGYQTAVGDWLIIHPGKFPEGMQQAAACIRKTGMTPGIWLAPFICERNSRLYREHPDWLLQNADNTPVRGGSNWSGFYALDIYHPEVRAYLREVFRTVTQEWGFGLLKLDFLYAACIVPRRDKTRGQIMSDGMRFLREISGDALLLGCGVPLASAFGRVDYCRIGCDVSLDWNDLPHMRLLHRERISTRNSVLNSVFRRQLDGRAFRNDPDVFLLRDEQNHLTADQKRCLAEVNALCGSVLFTSDNAAQYQEAQHKLLSRILRLHEEGEVVSAEISSGLLKLCVRFRGRLLVHIYPL